MWDWVPEEERRVMADVFAVEDARNRRREEKPKTEPKPEPKKSTGLSGSIFFPPGVYTNKNTNTTGPWAATFDTTGNFKFK